MNSPTRKQKLNNVCRPVNLSEPNPTVCSPGRRTNTPTARLHSGRRWHCRPLSLSLSLSHLTVFQRLCCCVLVKWWKVAAWFCESSLKIRRPASSHRAAVEECDNTAAELLVVTVVFTWWAALHHGLLGRIRTYFRVWFKTWAAQWVSVAFLKGSVHHKLLLLWFLLICIGFVYLPTFRSISGGKWSFVCVFITCRTQTAIETVPSDVCWSFTELKLNSIYLHKSYSSHLSHYQLICRLFSFNFSLKYQVNV